MSDSELWKAREDIEKLKRMLPVAITLPRYLWCRVSSELNNTVHYSKASPEMKSDLAAAVAVVDAMLVATRLDEP